MTQKTLKEQISPSFIKRLGHWLSLTDPNFSKELFYKKTLGNGWEGLELKQRVRTIVLALGQSMGDDYKNQLEILKTVVPQMSGLGLWIFPDFVEVYGQNHWDLSLGALKYFTVFFSSEFAVRTFLIKDPKKMLIQMKEWSRDENEHVRRLASEGCRPRLPWGVRLKSLVLDPRPILPILENLKDDPSNYVRKSVANNLNDISKNHPDLVLKMAQRWVGKNKNTDRVIKHGLRSLLKQGHPQALNLFQLKKPQNLQLKNLKLSQEKISIGSTLEFNFNLALNQEQKLKINFVIYYLKKNGSYGQKVFKLTEKNFAKGSHTLSRKHSLKQRTTRTHYPGKHYLQININGQSFQKKTFWLKNRGGSNS
ncbi:MAG: DNA alkylation repair protein [Bdellovibrionales bacterium]|nr:DNA alkylation repair protein [Bdellovibrionales bacterium]